MKMTSTVYMQMDLKVNVYSIMALLFAKPVGVLIVRFLSFSCGVPLRFFFFFSVPNFFSGGKAPPLTYNFMQVW